MLFYFFICCLKDSSTTKLWFDKMNSSNFKTDSISTIPKHFLEFQKNSKGYCLVKGSGTQKEIALTFDDGPTEVSLKIIEILNKYNAKATFFWVGKRIKGSEKIIRLVEKKGHLIANHSWNHENGYTFSNDLLWESQVEKTQKEFSDFRIKKCTFYRPPFGAVTQEQINFLATKNIKTVLWSITSMDWDPKENHEGQMFQKFKDQFHPGAIVLFHDYDYGNLDAKLNDLENILEYGKSQGYQFVTVAKLQL